MEEYVHNYASLSKGNQALKTKLRNVLRHIALGLKSTCNKKLRTDLRGVYCHYVFDDQKVKFAKIIKELKKDSTFINSDQMMDLINRKEKSNKKYLHLSFDDGFKNNFTNAYPILKELKVPATFFVPSDLIATKYDRALKFALEKTHTEKALEFMTWDDLAELAMNGYEIGCHSNTHGRLSEISNDPHMLNLEIVTSKETIEKKLGINCNTFSWPYGRECDIDHRTIIKIKQTGYKMCFSAIRGTITKNTDLYTIPRHHFEVHWPLKHILYFINHSK